MPAARTQEKMDSCDGGPVGNTAVNRDKGAWTEHRVPLPNGSGAHSLYHSPGTENFFSLSTAIHQDTT